MVEFIANLSGRSGVVFLENKEEVTDMNAVFKTAAGEATEEEEALAQDFAEEVLEPMESRVR